MPKGVSQRSIGGRAGIARKQIAARYALTNAQEPYSFPGPTATAAKTYSWSPPRSGYWKFVAWGAGGNALAADAQGAGSGAYAEKTKYLRPSDVVSISLTSSNPASASSSGGSTVLTFPDGSVVTCGGGQAASLGAAGGTATGGDVNLSGSTFTTAGQGSGGGSAGAGATDGGGAPGVLPYRGGDGGLVSVGGRAGSPGGGAAAYNTFPNMGGTGLVLAVFIHD